MPTKKRQPKQLVATGSAIDFLRARAAATDEPDPVPIAKPCIWCARPGIGLGYSRYKTLCAGHEALGAEFNRVYGAWVTRLLKADCPTGMEREGEEISSEYRRRGEEIAAKGKAVAA